MGAHVCNSQTLHMGTDEKQFLLYTCFILVFVLHTMGSSKVLSQDNNKLEVPRIHDNFEDSFSGISKALQKYSDKYNFATINWTSYPYKPFVQFVLAHSEDNILLKFYVTENHVLGRHVSTNSAVHQDSCVEFFISFDEDSNYYNFEFNCIGTTHLAYGPNIQSREFIPAEYIDAQVKTFSSLGTEPIEINHNNSSWELAILIRKEVFIHHLDMDFSNLKARANFYKCVDHTKVPHFLSWKEVETDVPNFHKPEFFGDIIFR